MTCREAIFSVLVDSSNRPSQTAGPGVMNSKQHVQGIQTLSLQSQY